MTRRLALRSAQSVSPSVLDVLRAAKALVLGDEALDIVLLDSEEQPEDDRPVLGLGVPGDVSTLSPKQLVNKGSALSDLVQALSLVLNLPDPYHYDYRVIEDINELDVLGQVVMFDIETAGDVRVDLPSETPIISMAFSDGERILVVPEELCESNPEQILDLLEARTVVAHNAKFDLRTVSSRLGGKVYPDQDTMLMHYAMNHGAGEHGLKPLAQRYFNAPEWEAEAKKYTKGGAHYENIPRDLLYKYNAGDVFWTGKLFNRFREQLEADPARRELYGRLMDIARMLQDVEDHAVHIDAAYLDVFGDYLTEQVEDKLQELRNLAANDDFNPGSWQQVKKVLEGRGLAVKDTSEGTLDGLRKAEGTDSKAKSFVNVLLEYRGEKKLLGTYVEGIKKRMRGNKVYPEYLVHGTTTGRLSSRNPNIQNFGRPDENAKYNIRNALVAPPGEVLVACDYSQAELRVLAEITGDEEMISAFQPGAVDYFDNLMPAAFPNKFSSVADFEAFKEAHKAEAKELRAMVKGVQYGCVTMDTKILTRRGWLTYDEVRSGDETPGIGGWTKVKEVLHYEDAPIEEFGNSRWSFKTTPNHRWAVRCRQQVDGVREYSDIKMKHQFDIIGDDIIEVADIVTDTHDDGLTDDEVAIISWILSDGYVNISDLTGRTSQGFSGQRRGITGYISQGKHPYVDEIDALLANVPHAKDTRDGTNYPVYVWRLRSAYLRNLWAKSGLFDSTVQEFVLKLNSAHREVFLDVFWKAEGHMQGGVRAITQKRGDKADAIMLAARLSGYRSTMVQHTSDTCRILLNKINYVTAQRVKRTDAGRADVWCVVTESGTWTMRQGDYVAITGNTNYGRGTKAIAQALDLSYDQAEQLLDGIYSTYPGLKVWQDRVRAAVTDPTLTWALTTPYGRVYQAEVVTRRNLNAVQNSALAFVPQSTANDICLTAAMNIHQRVGRYGGRIVGLVHDDIKVACPPDVAEDVAKLMQTEMEGAAEMVFKRVRFETDVSVGANWGVL